MHDDNAVRAEPPALEANNTDVFVWALYLLGGAIKEVDVEEIYIKAFELAPLRFGWRTRPDLPNFKKTAKALQEVEAKSHIGLLQKLGPNLRRLTPEGVKWVETYKAIFENNYMSGIAVVAPKSSELTRRVKEIRASEAWLAWKNTGAIPLIQVARIMNCSTSSSAQIWASRFADLSSLVSLTQDKELAEFLKAAQAAYTQGAVR